VSGDGRDGVPSDAKDYRGVSEDGRDGVPSDARDYQGVSARTARYVQGQGQGQVLRSGKEIELHTYIALKTFIVLVPPTPS
jgi:hypothetical protein